MNPTSQPTIEEMPNELKSLSLLMKASGISKTDLAKKLGCSPVNVSKILRGNPRISTLRKIAVALGLRLYIEFQHEHLFNDAH